MIDIEQRTLKSLGQRVAELEHRRLICLRDVADREWRLKSVFPSERDSVRAELEDAQRELARVGRELHEARLEFQRVEAEVNGRRLARKALIDALRPGGEFDNRIVQRREMHAALPDFALVNQEYLDAIEAKAAAVKRVEQLSVEICALEGEECQ